MFDWRSHTSRGKKDKKCDKKKKRKYDESSDSYWFDLFRKYMIFPTVSEQQLELYELAMGTDIAKITDPEKLHEIIFFMRGFMRDFDHSLVDTFEYNCSRVHDEVRGNYLILAIILTVMFGKRRLQYFSDWVTISLHQYDSQDEDEEELSDTFNCPLPTFCMLILYPEAQNEIPLDENDDENILYRAAPYLENTSSNEKDCCFFTMVDNDEDGDTEVISTGQSISISKRYEDEHGLRFCPNFFNAGARICIEKITARYYNNRELLRVNKYDSFDYC
ncbi:predicted protein [Naegleria gruberi]|uniref:Predicted protein n=1 Tax=Naegleria gruberi TaxID=5762 RepID=D2V1E4_NAEGR|nr:uncharacterized protein NAEGRDRAFT_45865 [Naegleria gruberi]EFC49151.1 predicted protein [Naegleria gruberi]|eukprot:XP_002681895.1 predicted protein [Naegleria gruberi strain NEG-M]